MVPMLQRSLPLVVASLLPLALAGPARAQPPAVTPEVAESWNAVVRNLRACKDQKKAGQDDAALKSVDQAVAAANKLPAGSEKLWLSIARAYRDLGAVTLAEKALPKAGATPDTESTRAFIRHDRRSYGLFPSAGIPPESEPAFVATYDRLFAALNAKKLSRSDLQAALAKYPQAPALKMIDCDAQLRANHRKQAEPLCESAIAAAPELARAHYLMGLARNQAGKKDEAVTYLRKSIDLDAEDPGVWQALGDVYRKSGKRQELAGLSAAYQKKFGNPLQ